MPGGTYRAAPEGYVTLAEAGERLGISKTKAWSLARSGALKVFDDPRDGRVKLVRLEDVERLAKPRPKE
jgi:hypothetical protein